MIARKYLTLELVVWVLFVTFLFASQSFAQDEGEGAAAKAGSGKKGSTRKVQEVNFAEMSLKGTVRNPEGAFLVQKKGIRFLPLIEVNQDMDSRIRNSTQYVK